ncbi:MAG: hypothetical protein HKN13_01550 [Rhodothermales bacterium]|nr:hypothetical protein [Rhodothermales bacterium]
MTYEDSEVDRSPETEFGFLIEHKDRLGKRIKAKPVEHIGSIQFSKLHANFMNLISVFHYLVANVDFSAFASADDEVCCHNHILFGEGEEHYYSIPYDFDMTGLVSAEYATPNPRYGLRRITQRFYRGRCENNQYLAENLVLFRDKRDEIEAVIDSIPDLSKYSHKLIGRLVGEFYRIVDDPKLVEKRLVERCN